MEWLNFHHLRYFHVVAREGSIAKAGQVLHTSQPAISTQLRQLEQALGEKLFQRHGRGLALTEAGRLVQGYTEQIFGLSRELLDAVRDRPTGAPVRVQIGVCDAVPKDLSFRLLEPLLRGADPARVVVHEDRAERLLASLAAYDLDLVIADGPIATGSRVKAFHHLLGESAIGVFGIAGRVKALRGSFPASLRGAPFLLPLPDSEVRRAFDVWARDAGLAPVHLAEVEDDALLRSLATAGHGFVLAPTVLARDLAEKAKLVKVADVPGLRVRYVAVTVARRVDNPAVVRLLAGARDRLFA
jgi:LysR family transcriptional activator of nhaA